MDTQIKLFENLMMEYIKNKDNITLSEILNIKESVNNNDNKYFLINKNKYELIIKKIDSLSKENKDMQQIMINIIKTLNQIIGK
jgi:hypothetical protein